jgi:uncharacterized delta-60 repeat protein
MKKILLVLAVSLGAVHAQTEEVVKSAFGAGEGVNGDVLALVVQTDGKIVIGGRFSAVNGVPRNNIARLNPDGTLDRSFANTVEAGVNGQVNALVLQPAGGVIVGGQFTQVGNVEALNLGRFNVDGTADKNFGTAPGQQLGANGIVYALTAQPDGKIVVGGNFSTVFGQPRRGVARLNTDNTLDGPIISQAAINGPIRALAATPDDSFIAGGRFTVQNQEARSLFKLAAPVSE